MIELKITAQTVEELRNKLEQLLQGTPPHTPLDDQKAPNGAQKPQDLPDTPKENKATKTKAKATKEEPKADEPQTKPEEDIPTGDPRNFAHDDGDVAIAPWSEAKDKKFTLEQLKEKAAKVVAAGKREAFANFLRLHGATKISEVKEADYASLAYALDGELE